MSASSVLMTIANKTPEEAKEIFLNYYRSMTPEEISKNIISTQDMAIRHGREIEREDIVCHLLASDMSVEEIAVLLCLRVENIRLIQRNYEQTLIPKYQKKLKERRKYREKKK